MSFQTLRDATSVTMVQMSKSKEHDCTITSTRTTSRSVEQPSFSTGQAATVVRPKSTGDNDSTSPFEAQMLLTEIQWKRYAECAKIIVGQIFLEFFPKFKFLKAVIPGHLSHEDSRASVREVHHGKPANH